MVTPPSLDTELCDRYLARLGVDREPPSVDALRRLHRAQLGVDTASISTARWVRC
jgi:hypothetical protein